LLFKDTVCNKIPLVCPMEESIFYKIFFFRKLIFQYSKLFLHFLCQKKTRKLLFSRLVKMVLCISGPDKKLLQRILVAESQIWQTYPSFILEIRVQILAQTENILRSCLCRILNQHLKGVNQPLSIICYFASILTNNVRSH
jgi:hypothetical protein